MSTPDFVKFSRIPHSPKAAIESLVDEVFTERRMRLTQILRLERDEGPFYGGLIARGEYEDCPSEDDAFLRTQDEEAFALAYVVPEIPAEIYVTLSAMNEHSCGLTIGLDSSIPYYEGEDLKIGEWLEQFLVSSTCALGASVAGYGATASGAYDVDYKPLDPNKMLASLNSGELFEDGWPLFHALSVKLISIEKVQHLLKKYKSLWSQKVPQRPQYSIANGYHIFSAMMWAPNG